MHTLLQVPRHFIQCVYSHKSTGFNSAVITSPFFFFLGQKYITFSTKAKIDSIKLLQSCNSLKKKQKENILSPYSSWKGAEFNSNRLMGKAVVVEDFSLSDCKVWPKKLFTTKILGHRTSKRKIWQQFPFWIWPKGWTFCLSFAACRL